ncbi:hypothetical protein Tco_1212105 [Tanacetum coccineum]
MDQEVGYDVDLILIQVNRIDQESLVYAAEDEAAIAIGFHDFIADALRGMDFIRKIIWRSKKQMVDALTTMRGNEGDLQVRYGSAVRLVPHANYKNLLKMGRDTIQLEGAFSTITEEYLLEFTSEYGILENLHPEVPGARETIVDFPEGKVDAYTRFFEFANYRIPLS